MLTQVSELRGLPEGHADFSRERADGCDGAVGCARPRPAAVRRFDIAELTEPVHLEEAGHTCGNIHVRDEVSQ